MPTVTVARRFNCGKKPFKWDLWPALIGPGSHAPPVGEGKGPLGGPFEHIHGYLARIHRTTTTCAPARTRTGPPQREGEEEEPYFSLCPSVFPFPFAPIFFALAHFDDNDDDYGGYDDEGDSRE